MLVTSGLAPSLMYLTVDRLYISGLFIVKRNIIIGNQYKIIMGLSEISALPAGCCSILY